MVVELLREIAGAREPQAFAGLEIPLEQEIDRRDPELLFRAEVIRDELERHAGVVGDRAQRCALVSVLSERIHRGVQQP